MTIADIKSRLTPDTPFTFSLGPDHTVNLVVASNDGITLIGKIVGDDKNRQMTWHLVGLTQISEIS